MLHRASEKTITYIQSTINQRLQKMHRKFLFIADERCIRAYRVKGPLMSKCSFIIRQEKKTA
jgi:hypothetical protein